MRHERLGVTTVLMWVCVCMQQETHSSKCVRVNSFNWFVTYFVGKWFYVARMTKTKHTARWKILYMRRFDLPFHIQQIAHRWANINYSLPGRKYHAHTQTHTKTSASSCSWRGAFPRRFIFSVFFFGCSVGIRITYFWGKLSKTSTAWQIIYIPSHTKHPRVCISWDETRERESSCLVGVCGFFRSHDWNVNVRSTPNERIGKVSKRILGRCARAW